MRFTTIILTVQAIFFACFSPVHAHELRGNVAAEFKYFFHDALDSQPNDSRQSNDNLSVALQPEYFHKWNDGKNLVAFTPFVRLDQNDDERSHFDIRELTWLSVYDSWELRLGIRKVFWGVTESQHLVDIINQTDLVENLDGEDKLGQPMINVAVIQDWGTLDLFVLTGFRERTFPGKEGRPRSRFYVDTDKTTYESSDEEKHIDFAARYFHYIGNWEFGLSHFYGTSRDPNLIPDIFSQTLTPYYPIINQTGLDIQAIMDDWLLKLEVISRDGQDNSGQYASAQYTSGRYTAATGGFEYTLVGIFETAADLGLIGEYLYDDRGGKVNPLGVMASPFQNDLMLGARLALNDVQSTQILAGIILDLEDGDRFYNVEAERRLGDAWKLGIEARVFSNLSDSNPMKDLRDDDFVQLNLEWFY